MKKCLEKFGQPYVEHGADYSNFLFERLNSKKDGGEIWTVVQLYTLQDTSLVRAKQYIIPSLEEYEPQSVEVEFENIVYS